MSQVKLTRQFRLTIPKAIRERLDLRVGQGFVAIVRGGTIVLVPKRSAEEMRGFMRGASAENYRDREDC